MAEFITSGEVATAMNYIIRALIALTKGKKTDQALRTRELVLT